MKTQRHLVVLTQEDQDRLREVLSEDGEDATAEVIGVSRIALLRGASGLGVLRGTRALIMGGLEDLDNAADDDADADDADDESEGEPDDDDDADESDA